jgi:hypothetical protein
MRLAGAESGAVHLKFVIVAISHPPLIFFAQLPVPAASDVEHAETGSAPIVVERGHNLPDSGREATGDLLHLGHVERGSEARYAVNAVHIIGPPDEPQMELDLAPQGACAPCTLRGR